MVAHPTCPQSSDATVKRQFVVVEPPEGRERCSPPFNWLEIPHPLSSRYLTHPRCLLPDHGQEPPRKTGSPRAPEEVGGRRIICRQKLRLSPSGLLHCTGLSPRRGIKRDLHGRRLPRGSRLPGHPLGIRATKRQVRDSRSAGPEEVKK